LLRPDLAPTKCKEDDLDAIVALLQTLPPRPR
jgi:hypothetical protein